MNSLVKEITKGLLPEEEKKETVAIYAGGFKPPTKGHFEVVKTALDQNPEIDKMIIYVGKKDRDGITQEQSLSVWAIYDNYLPFKVEVIPSTVAPIRAVYDYAKEHPNTEVLWVIGAREENQDDFKDIALRTKSITKYSNLELRTIVTKGGVSGTAARNALEKSPEAFYDYIPEFLSDKEKKEIYTTLKGTINEIGDLSVEPYNWNADLNKTDKNDPYDYYDFTTDDGIKYQVVFLREPIGNDAYINYDMSFVAKGGGDKGFSANALTGGNEPLKVMSTVVDITKSHMEYKGDADFITFEPTKGKTGEESAKDSTRGKLYKLIIKKNFPKAQVTGTDKVIVDVSAYKGEDMFEAISPDNSYSFKITDKTRDEEDNSLITVEYKFSTPDNTYRVEFYSGEYRPEDKTFDLSFGIDAGETNSIDTFQMTGEGNARKIFKTILNIVEDFLNKEDVEKIIVDGTSEKRKRIYKSIFSTSNLSDKIVVKEAVKSMSQSDFNTIGDILRDPSKAKEIHSLLLQMFPKQKDLLDYNYKNDSYAEFKRFIFNIDQYGLEGPTTIKPNDLKLDPQIMKDRERKYQDYVSGKINKYFRDTDSDPRKVDLSKMPPITVDETGEVMDGNHRAFLAIKQQKPLKGYKIIQTKNTHPNVSKILQIIGKPTSENINLPEAVVGDKIVCDNCGWDWKIKDGGDDLYTCHKCWHDNTPISSLNEEASYSQYIDVKQKIKELTKHMLDKGMNITPLPKVIFKHGDSSNAKEFLGQTAYYDPNSMSIVLYTEGRHPKDIVRSFSHEMIHHIQNLEDRLGNITTTNTQEDDSLNDLEAEANLKGTMTFRNWTDSLNENIFSPSPLQNLVNDYLFFITMNFAHLEKTGKSPQDVDALTQMIKQAKVDVDKLKDLSKDQLEKNKNSILQRIHDMLTYIISRMKAHMRPEEYEKRRDRLNKLLALYKDAAKVQENYASDGNKFTDSLQEGKTKDPFGLNAFAHELAMLREDEGEYKIYLDMDGVVADFEQRFRDLSGMEPEEFEAKYGKNAFWDFIDEGDNKVKFWVGIPPMEGAKELVDYVSQHDYSMLTAPSIKKQSRLGKNLWIRNHTGDVFPSKPHVIFKSAKTKHLVKPSLTKFDILIDDKPSTIDNWNNAGGTGILYLSASQVISQLQKLGL